MSFYVYILQSQSDGSYYKGFTQNPLQRLQQHNNGESKYTAAKMPWKLVYAGWVTDLKGVLPLHRIVRLYAADQKRLDKSLTIMEWEDRKAKALFSEYLKANASKKT